MRARPMKRYGWIQQVLVTAMIPAVGVMGPGSYLCMTAHRTIRVENLWSGGCRVGMEVCSTSGERPTIADADGPCGACTDMSLHLDSILPSRAETALRLVVASIGTAWICGPSLQPALPAQGMEPAFHPPQDATPSTILTVVLIV